MESPHETSPRVSPRTHRSVDRQSDQTLTRGQGFESKNAVFEDGKHESKHSVPIPTTSSTYFPKKELVPLLGAICRHYYRGGKLTKKLVKPLEDFVIHNEITSFEQFVALVGDKLPYHLEREEYRAATVSDNPLFYQGELIEGEAWVELAKIEHSSGPPTTITGRQLKKWVLGESGDYAAPDEDNTVRLVHMTFNKDYFEGKPVKLGVGSDGEFGGGFYMVSGHQPHTDSQSPQGKIFRQWYSEEKEKGPDDLVYFTLQKEWLQEFESDPDHLAFIVHMLQHPSGYPGGMSEEEAVKMMSAINAKGKVLLFPDHPQGYRQENKDLSNERKVTVLGEQERGWSDYRRSKDVPSAYHSIVIGPQEPGSLVGVRQIAFKDEAADLLINRASRTLSKYEEPRQYAVEEPKPSKQTGSTKSGKKEVATKTSGKNASKKEKKEVKKGGSRK